MLGPRIAAARAAGGLSRAIGRGGGTSLPGKVLLRIAPGAVAQLAARLPRGSAVISATNGKTTTAAMVASILEQGDVRLVHNSAGANMAGGIASTLLEAADGKGIDGDFGLFEVDEFWLGPLVADLDPRALLLGNLFRDQLDRYGELETIADRWAEIVSARPPSTRLVCNADDPLIADLGRDRPQTLFFGVDDAQLALPEMQHASDSKHCRNCGTAYVYDAIYLGHLGHYRCPGCGHARPEPDVVAREVELDGTRSSAFTLQTPAGTERIELPLPGLYNVYNAVAAAALALAVDAPLSDIVAGLDAVAAAFGRAETVAVGGREATILLVKNPAGANEVIRTLALERGPLDLLCVLNDKIADGRDISWVWDADFELLAGRERRIVCSGTRAGELALRFKYAGVDPAHLEVEPELPAALDRAIDGGEGTLHVLPTYTAMLALQELLSQRGATGKYWDR